MGAVRDPDHFTVSHAPEQRDGGVCQIVKRQQQGCDQMAVARKLQQAPTGQQPDRQAADIA